MHKAIYVKVLIVMTLFIVQVSANAQKAIEFSPADFDSIKQHALQQHFSGTITVIKNDRQIFHLENGTTDLTGTKKLSNDTRFNIGSIGKVFTSTLIMQLVAEHKLELDNTIDHYLTANYLVPNSNKITIRHLLSQTSGLGDFFDSPGYSEEKTQSIDDHLKLVKEMKPDSDTPGINFHYSNSGFIVLGKILELYYKKPYQQIVTEKLLRPYKVGLSTKQRATGYRLENDKWIIGEGNRPDYWTSAGGLFLSPNELHILAKNIVQNKIVSKETRELMWTKAAHPQGEPPFVNYGLGWEVENPFGIQLAGHNGGVRGFQVAFRYLPQANMYIYVFSNHGDGAEAAFMDMIMTLVRKQQAANK